MTHLHSSRYLKTPGYKCKRPAKIFWMHSWLQRCLPCSLPYKPTPLLGSPTHLHRSGYLTTPGYKSKETNQNLLGAPPAPYLPCSLPYKPAPQFGSPTAGPRQRGASVVAPGQWVAAAPQPRVAPPPTPSAYT